MEDMSELDRDEAAAAVGAAAAAAVAAGRHADDIDYEQ
jgi:hypothetical protein